MDHKNPSASFDIQNDTSGSHSWKLGTKDEGKFERSGVRDQDRAVRQSRWALGGGTSGSRGDATNRWISFRATAHEAIELY